MPDTLTGVVTSIINGEEFELTVDEIASVNPDQYDKVESIHLGDILDAESGSPECDVSPYIIRTPEDLEARLMNRRIRAVVKSRDSYGHLRSDISILE